MSKILLPILLISAFVGSTQAVSAWTCGSSLTINHNTVGGVAPVNKTVTYGTVLTDIAGTGDKCWITQNLGATHQASSATDSTEASAGWYWQFNRKQGYQYTTSRTPNTAWVQDINENSNWSANNDPCTLELGVGWRLPTGTEWGNADGAPQNWANYTDAYASTLRLHAAGWLIYSTGVLDIRGDSGHYWSSTLSQTDPAIYGRMLLIHSGVSYVTDENKPKGYSVRCLGTPSDIEAGSSGACGIVLSIGSTGSRCRSVKINSSGLFYDGGQVNCPD